MTVQRALGTLLGVLVRAWVFTLRVTVIGDLRGDAPRLFAFLHGQQMALLAHRRDRATGVIVSHSRDGELQAAAMTTLGFRVVRGSSSRGGARALAAITKALRLDNDAAFAVDGPRGPLGVPKPGAAHAARSAKALLLPVATAASRSVVLRKAWDQFEIPLPFSRVAIVVGEPIGHADVAAMNDALGRALVHARAHAERAVR